MCSLYLKYLNLFHLYFLTNKLKLSKMPTNIDINIRENINNCVLIFK